MWNYLDYTEEERKAYAMDVAEHFFTTTLVPFSDYFHSYFKINPVNIKIATDVYSAALSLGSFILFDTVSSYPFQSIGTYGNLPTMICDHIALLCVLLAADKKLSKNVTDVLLSAAENLQASWRDMHNRISRLLHTDNAFNQILDAFYFLSGMTENVDINAQFATLFFISTDNFFESMDEVLHK